MFSGSCNAEITIPERNIGVASNDILTGRKGNRETIGRGKGRSPAKSIMKLETEETDCHGATGIDEAGSIRESWDKKGTGRR
jgi:hypothetical protein